MEALRNATKDMHMGAQAQKTGVHEQHIGTVPASTPLTSTPVMTPTTSTSAAATPRPVIPPHLWKDMDVVQQVPTFSGNWSEWINFADAMEHKVYWDKHRFMEPLSAVRFAAAQIQGTHAPMARTIYEEFTVDRPEASVEEFLNEFRDRAQDKYVATCLRNTCIETKMGKEELFHDFLPRFVYAARNTGLVPGDYLLFSLIDALSPDFRWKVEECYKMSHTFGYGVWEDYLRAANSVDLLPRSQIAAEYERYDGEIAPDGTITCYKCGHLGHVMRECTTPKAQYDNDSLQLLKAAAAAAWQGETI